MDTDASYVVIDRSLLFNQLQKHAMFDVEAAAWIDDYEINMLTIPEFQKDMIENTKRWFPEMAEGGLNLTMLVLGLGGEAGEVCDALKKHTRGSISWQECIDQIAEETIDLFHYVALIWFALRIDPGEVYAKKTAENELRWGPKEA